MLISQYLLLDLLVGVDGLATAQTMSAPLNAFPIAPTEPYKPISQNPLLIKSPVLCQREGNGVGM